LTVVLEAEPEPVRQAGVWTLWGSAPSPPCAALYCSPPNEPRIQIEARSIPPGGLRGDERVRVVAKIAEYIPPGLIGQVFNPAGTLKLIEAHVTRGGAPSP
jgi:hypothetical protein